jgi:predicted phage-related endonuclease
MHAMRKIRGPKQYTPEWYALRIYDPEREEGLPKVTCGASRAAAACNQSEWATQLDLYREMRGYQDPWEPGPGDIRAELGLRMEVTVLDFAERLLPGIFPELPEGMKIRRNIRMHWLEDHDMTAASPDGMIAHVKAPVDSKTTWSPNQMSKFGREGTDEIPVEYLLQAQQQMLVMGSEVAYLPVLLGIGQIKCYKVEAHEDLQRMILESESELKERVVNDDPPQPNWTHPNTLNLMKQGYDVSSGTSIELSAEGIRAWHEMQAVAAAIKSLEVQRDAAHAKVLYAMGDSESAQLPGQRELVRRQYEATVVTEGDIEALRERIGGVKRKGYLRLWERKSKQ